jgi:hypothetical protein
MRGIVMSEWISAQKQLPEKNNWKVYAVSTSEDELHKIQICWFDAEDKTWHLQTDNSGKKPIKVKFWKDIDCNFVQFEQNKHKA